MIVDAGLEKESQLLVDNISKGKVGDDGTAPSASDTDLKNEITNISVQDSSKSVGTFTTKFTINSVTANGSTLREAGLEFSDGILYTRETHPDLEKTSSDEVVYFYRIIRERA